MTSRRLSWLSLIALAAVLAATTASRAVPLPTVEKTVTVEGLGFTLPIRPEASLGDGLVKLKATVSLAGLQQQAGPILHALATRKSRCETRWSFPELTAPTAADGRLRISGKVRVEFWVCKPFKTKLGRDTADFTLAVIPQAAPDQLSVRAELERLDLGKSIIRDIGLDDELRASLEAELNKALAGSVIVFPPEIAALNPKFTGVELKDNAGTAEIVATAEAAADATTIVKLIQLIPGL